MTQAKTSDFLVRKVGFLIHIVAWAIPLGIPFLFTGKNEDWMPSDFLLRWSIVIGSFMIVFYVNYFYLIKRLLSVKKIGGFLLANLLLMASVTLFITLIMEQLPPPDNIGGEPTHELGLLEIAGLLLRNILMHVIIVGLSVAIRMTSNWFETDALRKELERSRTEAELKNLKSQLNPHFLFNTLNNIYSLIALSPEEAQSAVHELSRLLRYVLYESSQEYVTVGKEIEFIRNYIELMRIRMAKNVDLQTGIEIENENTLIVPLLFISLIENAFKHGVSNNSPSFIHIRIKQDKEKLCCIIDNSSFPKDSQDKSGSGIGLSNLEKRLELLYPGMYSLRYGKEENIYHSELILSTAAL